MTYRAFSLNECSSRTWCGNLIHSIHIYEVFHPYGCVDAPRLSKKAEMFFKVSKFCSSFSYKELKNNKKRLHKPPNRSSFEILFRKHHTHMVYLSLRYAIPCAFLNWIFYDRIYHIVCTCAGIPYGKCGVSLKVV